MKCTYCGAEVADHHQFCMSCGTKTTPPAKEPDPIPWQPVWEDLRSESQVEEPKVQEPAPRVMERPQERRVTIDPEKFEFRPENQDEPMPKGVSSWELVPAENMAPRLMLPTKRGLGKMFFLGILTGGIYPTVIYSRIITELNILASRYDGKRTMPFFAMLMLAPWTLGIYAYVWMHQLCSRIGDELQRRGINYKFGAAHFWLWNILGAFILVGPFVFLHKLMKSMNLLNKDFNEKG